MSSNNKKSPPRTRLAGYRVQWSEDLPSTSDALRARAELVPWSVVVAERQSAGRGTQGRRWVSPWGGAYFSLVLPTDSATLRWAPFRCGIAVFEAAVSLGIAPERLSLKWPNDLLCDDRKVAGLLLENEARGCIAGIGVNVATPLEDLAPVTDGQFAPGSLYPERFSERHTLVAALVLRVLEELRVGAAATADHCAEQWERRCRFVGTSCRVIDRATQERYEGHFLGLGPNGEALFANADGSRRSFVAADWLP